MNDRPVESFVALVLLFNCAYYALLCLIAWSILPESVWWMTLLPIVMSAALAIEAGKENHNA